MLDATVGLIDIQQNKVIYILSIVGVVLTPPVLVASIYGMNFHHMPELDWPYGYAWALGLMLVSAIGPYPVFKLRGALRLCRSELHVELFDLVGLGLGGRDPLLHRRQRHDRARSRRRRRRRARRRRSGSGCRPARTSRRPSSAARRTGTGRRRPRGTRARSRRRGRCRACAPAQTLKLGWCAFRFIGSAERRLAKPECISPQIARQCARATRSAGSSPALGLSSSRYSAIASVSQTLTPSCSGRAPGTTATAAAARRGRRHRRSAAPSSSNSSPANRHSSQPRSDQDE